MTKILGMHTTSFKYRTYKVGDFGNFELSPINR